MARKRSRFFQARSARQSKLLRRSLSQSVLAVERLEDRRLLAADFMPHELLIQFHPAADEAARTEVRQKFGGSLKEHIETPAMRAAGTGVLELVKLPPGLSVADAAGGLRDHPQVRFSEPNWVFTHQDTFTSNDPLYANGSLWGMYGANSDGTANQAGLPADTTNQYGSQAEEAWAAGKIGSRTTFVGIVDEGIDHRHPDLYMNIAINQLEIPVTLSDVDQDGLITFYDLNYKDSNGTAVNQGSGKITDRNGNGYIDGGDLLYSTRKGGWADGKDADGNGYVDDLVGWDFAGGNNTTYDGSADDHGTHVAGTIGASGGNAAGVAGMNWAVSMIPVKFLGSNGGTLSNAIKAIDYVTSLKTAQGRDIVATNNSWGGGGFSQGLLDAIGRAANADILFVAAAGNGGSDGVGDDNDTTASYPANYDTTSIAGYNSVMAVAAIDKSGNLASFSNYGASTVHLGAPGVGVTSTLPDAQYGSYSGTSMATPHVAGGVALYAAVNPAASAAGIRNAVLGAAFPTSPLSGKTVTDGRLDAAPRDVAVTTLTATPGLLVLGGEVLIDVTVGNQGLYDELVDVTLKDGETVVQSWTGVALKVGASAQLPTILWTPTTAGDHSLAAHVSPVTDERDTADNSQSTAVRVVESAVYDVAVASVVAPTSVLAGGTATVQVAVVNNSTQEETFTVSLTDTPPAGGTAGQVSDPQTVSLAPGASTTLSFIWTTGATDTSLGATAGHHSLTATVSLGTDTNATNDSASAISEITYEKTSTDGGSFGDWTTGISYLDIAEDVTIQDLNVRVRIDHLNVSDVILSLRRKNADGTTTAVQLFNRRGGSGDHILATFDDQAAVHISAGKAPYDGTTDSSGGFYIPEQALNAFHGQSTQGTWELWVEDRKLNGIGGTLHEWTLIVNKPTAVSSTSVSLTASSLEPTWFSGTQAATTTSTPQGATPAGSILAVDEAQLVSSWQNEPLMTGDSAASGPDAQQFLRDHSGENGVRDQLLGTLQDSLLDELLDDLLGAS